MPSLRFALVAHRGDSSKAPENTLHAFDKALQQGYCNFETDCQLTKDSKTIILHDENLGKTTNGSGQVAEHTWEQLQQLDAGSWFDPAFANTRMPLLEDALKVYKGKAHIHLELKSQQPQLPSNVAALVQQHGWDSYAAATQAPGRAANQQSQQRFDHLSSFQIPGLTITSFHIQQLQSSKKLLPQVPHGWLVQEVTDNIISTAKACGFEMVCPRANALTAAGVQRLVDEGFVVRAWGVKNIELLLHVVKCGAHGATVNWPAEAAEALKSCQQEEDQ